MDQSVTNSERRPLLRPVHKPVMLMQHIHSKFTKPGVLVIDPCMGTVATAKGCLTEPLHFKTTGCDSDERCAVKMMPCLQKTFAWQILNEDSGTVENADVENAARLLIEHCTIARSGVTTMKWKTSKGLPSEQSFPHYVTQFKPQSNFIWT